MKTDLPRDKYHTYRSVSPKPVFIYAKYVLTMDEQEAIAELSGHSVDELSQVVVSKDFDGNLFFEFPFVIDDNSSVIEKGKLILEACKSTLEVAKDSAIKVEIERREKALESIRLALELLDRPDATVASLSTAYDELKSFDEDVKSSVACVAMSEAIQKFKVVISESSKPQLSDTETVTDYIEEHMPKYVYYSNYGNLDSQIYLPQVLQNISKSDLGVKEAAKARTLRTLFKFVHLDPKEITDLGTETTGSLTQAQIDAMAEKKKEREILLSSASSAFTKSFNEWWKQGNYTFEFQADGNFFRIWVSDSVRPERIELESRSTGLQWFFSFYLVFLVESEQHHQNAILLLDEPGVTLHPLAQKDLFQFFENLAQNNQILYTTHSPFMVDSNHLERVRSIYIDADGKTVASPDLRAAERLRGKNQPQSIYPAHAAHGLSVSDTLLMRIKV